MDENTSLGVLIRNKKAYVSNDAITEAGWRLIIEPILVTTLDELEMVKAIEEIKKIGNPRIPTPTVEELKKRPSPLLRIAKVNSWKKLAQGGVSYSIIWRPEYVVLYVSNMDKKGYDPAKTRKFSKNVPTNEIVCVILIDLYSRPELQT